MKLGCSNCGELIGEMLFDLKTKGETITSFVCADGKAHHVVDLDNEEASQCSRCGSRAQVVSDEPDAWERSRCEKVRELEVKLEKAKEHTAGEVRGHLDALEKAEYYKANASDWAERYRLKCEELESK